jgi:hypothetical protein
MVPSKLPPQRNQATSSQQFDIDEFEAVESQIASAREEILVLVKKSPHDALRKFKLSVVNGLLLRANRLLIDDRPLSGFEQFDTEVLPSASDVAMVLGQHLAALENLRVKHIRQDRSLHWYWIQADDTSQRRTYPPRKLDT